MTLACVWGQYYKAGMAAIVGVHGIAQQFKGGYELGSVWFDALRDGLATADCRPLAARLMPADVRVAFFGDLFRPDRAMAAAEPPYTPDDVEPGPEQDMLECWYQAAAEQDASLGSLSAVMGPARVTVEVMLERLLRSRTLARVTRRGLIGSLKQVTAFLGKPDVKERVLERVGCEVTPHTRVVIGHSLGSVVAYEYLALYRPPRVELLITLGSPLGIPNLVFDRLTPAPDGGSGSWPGRVRGWVNVADADDFIALRKRLAPLFPAPPGSAGIEDHLVDNGDEPHAIERYLNARSTGKALCHVLRYAG